MNSEILIVDDNADIRYLISGLLKDKGFDVRQAANFKQAIAEIDTKLPDVAVIDVKLDKGDNDGIELLSYIKKIDKDVPVIMISGHANIQMAVDSLKKGAFEFIQKPFDAERILNFVYRALENYNLKKENIKLSSKLFHSYEFIGETSDILKIKSLILKLANTESRVFISGPAGSGKELIARKIHKQSNRSNKPFVIINGALLDPKKYEQELFGSENNGIINYGVFEKAKGGTLLIDEVSEIPLETQAKILRVLIDQKFKRINGIKEINVNVRLISTSTKNIRHEVDQGNFREDLFHRLNVVPIEIPSLKDRTSDIPLLLNYFCRKISELNNINPIKIETPLEFLDHYDWPGNVRELRNLVERASILAKDEKNFNLERIIKDSLIYKKEDEKVEKDSSVFSYPLKKAREQFEKSYLTTQLKRHRGNISKTADFVGMERSALHRKLKSLGIKGIN